MTCEGKKPHEFSQRDLRKAFTFHQTRAVGISRAKGGRQKEHGARANELKRAIDTRKAASFLVE